MAQPTFSLSWESHKSNICNGLSALQQNGEFVDMTLAADGHHVKVHQMVMALASPYIKELITSANCPHPVIYLNKISYKILSAILEYIYTGEVLISIEHLSELLAVARELHIKGLEEMNINDSMTSQIRAAQPQQPAQEEDNSEQMEDDICYFEVASRGTTPSQRTNYTVDEGMTEDDKSMMEGSVEDNYEEIQEENDTCDKKPEMITSDLQQDPDNNDNPQTVIQYTISNQGSLQMIVNRYVYYLKHSNRNNTRQWRCVDYLNTRKCPALVFTKNDAVLQRISAHNHAFHDKKILTKVRANSVYTALQQAETMIKSRDRRKGDENDEIII